MRLAPLGPTLTLSDAAATDWDAIVVGAGPAGSTAARELALAGARVLLVDKAAFPRDKVCGCCVNAAALSVLEATGLGELPGALGGVRLSAVTIRGRGCAATLPLPGGLAVSRAAFDAALAAESVRAGVAFLPSTNAALMNPSGEHLGVRLRQGQTSADVFAKTLVAADGLGGRLLAGVGAREPAAHDARMGCGAILPNASDVLPKGVIHMACGRGGYVGMVRLDDERLDVAGAFDPAYIRQAGGPSNAVAAVLAEAGFAPLPRLAVATWKGTPALTRRASPIAGERLFVIGDAAGYVEPFTGEGIAWALASGVAVAPLALRAARAQGPSPASAWTRQHRRMIVKRHRLCRAIAFALRRPRATALALRLVAKAPSLASPLVRRVNAPWRFPLGVASVSGGRP